MCNRFRTAKLRQREAGEITARTYDEYVATTDRLVTTFGKGRLVDDLAVEDFEALRGEMAKQWGPVRLGNEVQKVRTVFKYGFEAGLIDKPVRFGPQFKKPSASVLRRHRIRLDDHDGPEQPAKYSLQLEPGGGPATAAAPDSTARAGDVTDDLGRTHARSGDHPGTRRKARTHLFDASGLEMEGTAVSVRHANRQPRSLLGGT